MAHTPNDGLQAGLLLFNRGDYWHAHEQWEQCWLTATEPDATFYKGLIQAAAALVHWQRGNPRGLQRNWFKARPRLVALPSQMYGLDLRTLIAAMDRMVISGGGSPAPLLQAVDPDRW